MSQPFTEAGEVRPAAFQVSTRHTNPDPRQVDRPHVFVTKMRDRFRTRRVLGHHSVKSCDLTLPEFTSAYSAAAFAAEFDILLDVAVTIDLGRLGINAPADVQPALSKFTRCYSAWCTERWITPAWIAVVEMGGDRSYHAHLALHVPGDLDNVHMRHRTEFRAWIKGYTARRGGWVPRAIKVHAGRKHSLLAHWINFHYLAKGFDRSAVVCAGRNSTDGRLVKLGDLIARTYQDPGPPTLGRRFSISQSLGPARREFGAPPGRENLLPHGPNWACLDIDRWRPLTAHEELTTQWQVPIPTPYRSPLEDGIYDVRRLYPRCFYEFVTKVRGH